MDAANPLGRFLPLAAGLLVLVGCQSDAPVRARGQLPLEPLAPVAPPPPNVTAPAPYSPIAPYAPIAPGGGPAGVVPASPGGTIPGSPVPQDAKGPVVGAGFTNVKTVIVPAADLLKKSIPRVKPVAIVGASLTVITDQEVLEAVWQQNQELVRLDGPARKAKEKELYSVALRRTIERELILDEMYTKLKKANKMAVVDEIRDMAVQMTNKQLGEMKKQIGAKTEDDFATFLRIQGLTLPVLRRQFERQIMAQQFTNSMLKEKGRRVGFAEIREYYDRHPDEFKTGDRAKWQHIFISTARHPNAQAAQSHAQALLQQATTGADFGALSRKYDDGFARNQNGFGTGEKRGEIQPADVEPTVWALKPGQLSALIPTPAGFHIVKVVERDTAGVRPFDPKLQGEIRDKLNKVLYEADEAKMIEDLWRKGVVRVIAEE